MHARALIGLSPGRGGGGEEVVSFSVPAERGFVKRGE